MIFMQKNNIDPIIKILQVLGSKRRPMKLDEIKEATGITDPISLYVLWLLEMGFIKEERKADENYAILGSTWEITSEGHAFLKFITTHREAFSGVVQSIRPFSLVLTYPRSEKLIPKEKLEKLSGIGIYFQDLLGELFRSAQEEILIASPYIEQVILPFVEQANKNVKIKIITNEKNALLERITKRDNVKVFILQKKKENRQLYQVHSKFMCVDGKYCVVGSMNLNERSIYYNFETGIFIEDENLGEHLKRLFEIMIELSSPLTL